MSQPSDAPTAPKIGGYTLVRPIGHGGFSDVYLYEQAMPRRDVAIKVLRTDDLSDVSRAQFAAEANLMARVSNHSNIAAIYAADVDEDGQPYLVMEYCSGGSLGAFYRHYPMSVKEVLSLGIRLAGALEAAHRAGIVHRDIKPANILLTEYGVPVLTDFGISTIDEDFPDATRMRTMTGYGRPGTGESSVGMSLPWAAPETLWEEPVSDTRSDRYSLAATLFSLLEGRSPHEVPGGPNSASHLTGRIQSGFIGAMRRPDVPASLRQVLMKGLAHDRAARWQSATSMGRALQDVQRELGLEVTPLEVPRGGEVAEEPPSPVTRVRQAEPIQRPDGEATWMPGAAPPAGPGGPGQPGGPGPSGGPPPGSHAFGATSFGATSFGSTGRPGGQDGHGDRAGWPPGTVSSPLRLAHPPPDPRQRRVPRGVTASGSAGPHGPGGRGGPVSGTRSRVMTYVLGALLVVLLLAVVVVFSLLIGRTGQQSTAPSRSAVAVAATAATSVPLTPPPGGLSR